MGRFKKWLAASDLHGNLQEKSVVKELLKFKEAFNPDETLFLGDLFDLRALLKRATDEDKSVNIIADVEAGMEFIREYRPNVKLKGNHSRRLDDLALSRDTVRASLAQKLIGEIDDEFRSMGTLVLPYDKRKGVYKMGHLSFVHGYAAGIGATRRHGLAYGNVIHGHTHHIECCSIETHAHVTARAIGCLCQLDMDYNHAHIGALRQAHGWAYGVTDTKTGNYFAVQSQKIGDKWFFPSDFKI